jgi:hypothetical protein
MDIISSLNNSITLVRRLQEISTNVTDAEFKKLLAELSRELADAKIEATALQEMIAALKEENGELVTAVPDREDKPVKISWGCYQFRGDRGLYCTGCWDSHHKKVRTNRLSTMFRQCPVCQMKVCA